VLEAGKKTELGKDLREQIGKEIGKIHFRGRETDL